MYLSLANGVISVRCIGESGYRCFALEFFEEYVQAAFTTDCECCVTPSTVQYIRALTIAGSLESITIINVF